MFPILRRTRAVIKHNVDSLSVAFDEQAEFQSHPSVAMVQEKTAVTRLTSQRHPHQPFFFSFLEKPVKYNIPPTMMPTPHFSTSPPPKKKKKRKKKRRPTTNISQFIKSHYTAFFLKKSPSLMTSSLHFLELPLLSWTPMMTRVCVLQTVHPSLSVRANIPLRPSASRTL